MKRFIDYGSIEQYIQTVKKVKDKTQFIGVDKDGKAQFDSTKKLPEIVVTFSEKIHGTNAGVCYSNSDGLWAQSRKKIITTEKDNAGFAFFVESKKAVFENIIKELAQAHGIDLDKNIVSLYGEWAGGSIQKHSALTGIDKRFIIFQHFKVSPIEPDENTPAYWLLTSTSKKLNGFFVYDWVCSEENKIYNIMNLHYIKMNIDFNEPQMYQNTMIEKVKKIEENSIAGEYLGRKGNIGEGYVGTFRIGDELLRFKIKGEKHAKSAGKVKTLKPVDEEKENKKREFVNKYACQEFRLDQMYNELKAERGDMVIEMTGDYLRSVIKDTMKEEMDILVEMQLEPKEVNSLISQQAREYFMSRLDAEVFGD